MIFERLPEVDKCCFCISMRVGIILVTIYGLMSAILSMIFYVVLNETAKKDNWNATFYQIHVTSSCYANIEKKQCVQHAAAHGSVVGVLVATEALVAAASVALFVGIFYNAVTTATIFMFTYTITRIPEVIRTAFFVIAGAASCKSSNMSKYQCFVDLVIQFLLWFYVVVVVKSYRTIMKSKT